jgi:uncharacterized membrane protein
MTASKSSRARNARAQAIATRNGTAAAGRAGGNGTAVKTDSAVKTSPAVKTSTEVRSSTAAKTGTTARTGAAARTAAVRSSQPVRAGSRSQVAQEESTGASLGTGTAVPLWMQLATFLLALAGLGVSIYLTIAHFTESTLAGCTETSGLVNCTKVTTSAESYVFGIPVAVLGLAFFVFAVAIMSPWAWRSTRREVHLVRLASVVVGVGFVLYLLYAELFMIGSICLYCTSVHVITFALFALTVFAAAAWGLDPARRSS